MLLESCPVLTSVCLVGMKLQLIILDMALEIQGRHAVVKGIPVVQLTDKLFWFGRPQFMLFLIHFTLFQVSKYLHCKFIILDIVYYTHDNNYTS